jgi:hypothetical protein
MDINQNIIREMFINTEFNSCIVDLNLSHIEAISQFFDASMDFLLANTFDYESLQCDINELSVNKAMQAQFDSNKVLDLYTKLNDNVLSIKGFFNGIMRLNTGAVLISQYTNIPVTDMLLYAKDDVAKRRIMDEVYSL